MSFCIPCKVGTANVAATPPISISRCLLGEIRHALTDMANCGQINIFSPSESVSLDAAAVQRAEMFTTVVSANVSPRVVLGVIWALSMLLPSQAQGTCQPLTISLCQGLQLYNDTIFPNILNHSSQIEAAMELNQFTPLVKMGCSRDLAHFLCSVYAPYCLVSKNLATPVPPCRSLCNSAKRGCKEVLKRFGFSWPKSLKCRRFPKLGKETCVDRNGINKATVQPPTGGKTQLELVKIHSYVDIFYECKQFFRPKYAICFD